MSAAPSLLGQHLRALFLVPILEYLESRPEAVALPVGDPLDITAGSALFRVGLVVDRLPVQPALPGALPADVRPVTPTDLSALHRRILSHASREPATARKLLNSAGLKHNSHNRQAITELIELGYLARPKRGRICLARAA